MTPQEITSWWLGPAQDDVANTGARMKFWFTASAGMDEVIRQRFADAVDRASRGELDDWVAEPAGRLALILLLDQFRRNLYRGLPEAFTCDDTALHLCLEGIELGLDKQLSHAERLFFYMPMQHSESGQVQSQAVEVFEALALQAPEAARDTFNGCAKYAQLHRDIIVEFGRFPHRNAVLGRQSTDAEKVYLKDGPTFGQG